MALAPLSRPVRDYCLSVHIVAVANRHRSIIICRDPGGASLAFWTHYEQKRDRAMSGPNPRPTALDRLSAFIGRWLTEGETVATPEAPSVRIFASDVYQWGPGGQFIMHPAYGRIGEQDVGGLEVIGYDPATDQFRTHFFDHTGHVITETLTFLDGTWTWQATHHRCKGVFTDNGKTLTARHERSDHGKRWAPSMTVTLRKVE